MKNNKIAIKLFFLTSAVFIAFISLTLLFQMFFFERYYESKKQQDFTVDLETLSQDLSKNMQTYTTQKMIEKFKEFDENNGSKTILVNVPEYNNRVVKGQYVDDRNYIKYAFDTKINEKVKAQLLREWAFFNSSRYLSVVLNDKSPYIYKKEFGDYASIVGAGPVISTTVTDDSDDIGTVNSIVFSVISLQPVGDAVDTLKDFYIYIYLVAILVILILAYLYSVMISKPLIKLKNSAEKMTELDFSVKCEIKSNDEIGELGSALNFLSDRLDTTLTELTESNEKLKEDIEKERALEFMRKEFVAGVSHELKTPITLIGGYAEALKDNIAREEDKQFFVEVIMDESKKMEYIIKDMLELSQLEAGSLKMNMEQFNITELVQSVARKFTRAIDDKRINVETHYMDELIMVSGDSIRIEQVLVNLMSNAMKNVVEDGRLILRIERNELQELQGQRGQKNRVCTISVENEGKHIPEDELDKVWERFYKVDKSRTREVEGTGIGLSIVKNILQLHDSSFGAENTPIGVKFHFSMNEMN